VLTGEMMHAGQMGNVREWRLWIDLLIDWLIGYVLRIIKPETEK
jgi:hypothetical protein